MNDATLQEAKALAIAFVAHERTHDCGRGGLRWGFGGTPSGKRTCQRGLLYARLVRTLKRDYDKVDALLAEARAHA